MVISAGRLEYMNGMTASVHLDYMQECGENHGRNVSIVGEKGFIYSDFKQVKLYNNNGDIKTYNYSVCADDYISLQFDMFLDYILHNNYNYCVTADEGVKIIKLIEALYSSAAKNTVEFL